MGFFEKIAEFVVLTSMHFVVLAARSLHSNTRSLAPEMTHAELFDIAVDIEFTTDHDYFSRGHGKSGQKISAILLKNVDELPMQIEQTHAELVAMPNSLKQLRHLQARARDLRKAFECIKLLSS